MQVEALIDEFATARNVLPRESMRCALDQWDEVAPGLLELLTSYTDGTDRSERNREALFFALHLMGQAREKRAFISICRLIQDDEALEAALGDAVTGTLSSILIGTYDGNLGALKDAIECEQADEFARSVCFDALAYLTAVHAVPQDETERYLRRLYAFMRPQSHSYVWVGWQDAVARLGLESMTDLVQKAFEREFVHPGETDYEWFQKDLHETLSASDPIDVFTEHRIGPLDDVIAELSRWYFFTEKYVEDQQRIAARGQRELAGAGALPASSAWASPQPHINPLRDIGRNDPCPCGSGKKYKKCCLN